MRPKIILQLYPMLPAAGEDGRKRQRPLGRDSSLYHRVVHEWLDIIKAADEMGVWGASTIEHHLHSEGYEVGPNPGVLNAWWAGQVKNLHVGALGYVENRGAYRRTRRRRPADCPLPLSLIRAQTL